MIMFNRKLLIPLVIGLLCMVLLVTGSREVTAETQTATGTLTYTLTAPDYEVITDASGQTQFALEGFHSTGLPGDPNLPAARSFIALPPGVTLETVAVTAEIVRQRELAGTFDVAPAGPDVYLLNEGERESWGPNANMVADGRNMLVYGGNATFPATPVELIGAARLGRWHYAELRYWPVSFNPGSGQARLASEVLVTLTYDLPPSGYSPTHLRQDAFTDELAREMLLNFDEAQSWYKAATSARTEEVWKPRYLIVTTNAIRQWSESLDRFAAHKDYMGFDVQIVTEDDYASQSIVDASQAPHERPQLVREWLKREDERSDIAYVLLIGNPYPLGRGTSSDAYSPGNKPWAKYQNSYGGIPCAKAGEDIDESADDLPMLLTWPLGNPHDAPPGQRVESQPTDHYFANLTGDWNAQQQTAEYYFAEPADGVEFGADILVGRIPIYIPFQKDSGDGALLDCAPTQPTWAWTLDQILEKTIAYELSPDRAWRRSAFLPMTFLTPQADMARMAEAMKGDYLDAAGFSTYSMYLHNAPNCSSEFVSDGELATYGDNHNINLTTHATRDYWEANPSGIVAWNAHGGPASPAIGYNDCLEEYDFNGAFGNIFHRDWVERLSDERPALTFQGACSNGKPEEPNNLAYRLLEHGAVGTVAGTGNTPVPYPLYPVDMYTNVLSLGYYYAKHLVEGHSTGQALFRAKRSPDPSDAESALGHNLYGDPSIRLAPSIAETLSAGEYHSCALKPDGSIDCWGAATHTVDHGQAEDQPGPYTQVGAGALHTCALRPNGGVDCWGLNDFGQATAQAGPFTQLAVGGDHNCGLRPDGSVDCWGRNDHGGGADQAGPFVEISAGWEHTCGLTADGAIECWGLNEHGEADDQVGPYIQVSAGWGHTCGLQPNGDVDCWGQNNDGQAADQVGPFIQVSAGGRHTCALERGGRAVCWGLNSYGQAQNRNGPFSQISAGGTWMITGGSWGHTCGLRPNGQIECWGAYTHGQAWDQRDHFGPRQADGNLLANYSFYRNVASWRYRPSGQANSISSTTRLPYVGTSAVEIKFDGMGRPQQLFQKDVHLQPNTQYELSFIAYSNNGEDMSVMLHKHGKPYTDYGLGSWEVDLARSDRNWKIFRNTFTTPDLLAMDDARLRFWFRPYSQGNTVYHIDHVVLRPVGEP